MEMHYVTNRLSHIPVTKCKKSPSKFLTAPPPHRVLHNKITSHFLCNSTANLKEGKVHDKPQRKCISCDIFAIFLYILSSFRFHRNDKSLHKVHDSVLQPGNRLESFFFNVHLCAFLSMQESCSLNMF